MSDALYEVFDPEREQDIGQTNGSKNVPITSPGRP